MKKFFLLLAAVIMAAGTMSAQDLNKAIEAANNGNEAFQLGEYDLAIESFKNSLAIAEELGEEGNDDDGNDAEDMEQNRPVSQGKYRDHLVECQRQRGNGCNTKSRLFHQHDTRRHGHQAEYIFHITHCRSFLHSFPQFLLLNRKS